MNKLLICFALFFVTIYAHAQSIVPDRAVVDITQFSSSELMGIRQSDAGIRSVQGQEAAVFERQNIIVPLTDLTSFLAFSIVWEAQNWDAANNQLWVRFKSADIPPVWKLLNIDVHAEKKGNRLISELTFAAKSVDKLDIKIVFGKDSEALVQNLKLHFYNPGDVNKKSKTASSTAADMRVVCTCPQPDFQTRADWCPTGDCPENTNPSTTTVTHLIVHHSAGVNNSTDWAAVVRSIWDYHVNVNGWSDIGYNYLVDPNGVLYEGRGDNILGAHFCGTNGGTMGVCMMGDFTNISPTSSAIAMLKNLLVWKICDIDADPEGSAFHASSNLTLDNISGHQDGCATACPGANFYPQLPAIRAEVSEQINNDCEVNTALPYIGDLNMEVYPNPMEDWLFIKISDNDKREITIRIFEMGTLRCIKNYSGKANGTTIIQDVSDLPKGVYFLQVGNGLQQGFMKLVKQ